MANKIKTKLEIKRHHTLPNTNIVDVMFEGQRIASICGSEGAGIRITTEHSLEVAEQKTIGSGEQKLKVMEVRVC